MLQEIKGSFGIKSFIIKRTFDRVDKVIACSDSTRTKVEVAYRLRTDKLRTIYPGVSVPEVTQAQVESLRKKFKKKFPLGEKHEHWIYSWNVSKNFRNIYS